MIKINRKFLFILLISFLYAFFEGEYFANAIFICLVSVTLFSLIYIIIATKVIKVKITRLNKNFITGEKIEANISLENKNFIPINYIEVKYYGDINCNSENQADILNLKGREVKNIKLNNSFHIRGVYNIANISLIIKDIFNIFYLKKSLNDKINVKVYPKVLQVNDFYNSSQNQLLGENLLYSVENNTFTKDIRKYQIGDNLKRIHWKVSAKYGELYTKNYEIYSNEVYTIFLDMNEEIYQEEDGDIIEESAIEFVISLCKYISDKNLSAVLNINNEKSMKFILEKSRNIEDIQEYFLYNKSSGKEDFIYYIESRLNEIKKTESIIIVIPFLKENVWKGIIEFIKLGYKFKIFYYKADSNILYEKDMLKEMGIECISFRGIVNNF